MFFDGRKEGRKHVEPPRFPPLFRLTIFLYIYTCEVRKRISFPPHKTDTKDDMYPGKRPERFRVKCCGNIELHSSLHSFFTSLETYVKRNVQLNGVETIE